MEPLDVKAVKELFVRHGLSFTKSLGQNFLVSARVLRRIVTESGIEGYGVLEIGSGIGTLTRELVQVAQRVCTVEIDRSFMPVLQETLAGFNNVSFINADILKTDIPALAAAEFSGLHLAVCANLPYYITTPVIEKLVQAACFERMTLMVQKEAARRICAHPGSGAYGAFTAWLAYYMENAILFDVPAGCFFPPPKVDSSVVLLKKRAVPAEPVRDEGLFAEVIGAAFMRRRKTLLNALHEQYDHTLNKERLRGV